jgi:hypothetical protein
MNRWETGMEQRPMRTVLLVCAIALVAGLIVVGVLWGLGVILSPVKGAGDSYSRKNSADNFISAQAQFEADYAQLGQFKANIAAKAGEVTAWEKAHPAGAPSGGWDQAAEHDQLLHSDLSGLTNQCNALVADYNARSRQYLSQDFKAVDLPAELSATECAAPSTGG